MPVNETDQRVIAQFRAGGPVDGMHRERLLLLTTTGRTTGRARTCPTMFHREGDRLVVVAANNGASSDPGWCLNLLADPNVIVEIDDEEWPGIATPLVGRDREQVWVHVVEAYPFFEDLAAQAERIIPLVELSKR